MINVGVCIPFCVWHARYMSARKKILKEERIGEVDIVENVDLNVWDRDEQVEKMP